MVSQVSEELGLHLPDDDDAELLTDAFLMFLSYGLCGLVPVAIFCLSPTGIASSHVLYLSSVAVSLVSDYSP